MWRPIVLAALSLLLTACGVGGAPHSLAGTAWVLVSVDGAAVPPDPAIRLEFSAGEASGFAGCNFFSGFYQADRTTLRLQQVAQSAMACDDSGLMDRERVFLDALRATETYQVQAQTLELRDASGVARLVFRSQ